MSRQVSVSDQCVDILDPIRDSARLLNWKINALTKNEKYEKRGPKNEAWKQSNLFNMYRTGSLYLFVFFGLHFSFFSAGVPRECPGSVKSVNTGVFYHFYFSEPSSAGVITPKNEKSEISVRQIK